MAPTTSFSMKPILVVLTNANTLGQNTRTGMNTTGKDYPETDTHRRTGFNIKEVAYIWITLHKKLNAKIVFASPRGGEAPVDPESMKDAERDDNIRDFVRDRTLLDNFRNTQPLDNIKPEDYQLVLLPGCQGAMVDFPDSHRLTDVLCKIYERNGYIATIGHGAAGLLNLKTKQGEYWIKGRRMTAFTTEEEREKGHDKILPYLLEEKLKERGAKFEKTKPHGCQVVVDERLITAQNCNSVQDWIKKIMEAAGA